jgi:hypothetical protein
MISEKTDVALWLTLFLPFSYVSDRFVYFQPGNGKVNIKEPKELARKSMKQIEQAINLVKDG